MAQETLSALVRREGPLAEVGLAAWSSRVGNPGELWVEEEGRTRWLVRVLKSPLLDGSERQARLVRRATAADMELHGVRAAESQQLRAQAAARAKELGLPMKFLGAELDLDRTLLRLFFVAPERVDFRELLRDLTGAFKLRLELRQLGPRDAAKLLGTVGPCGCPLCCRTFLHKLRPVPLELAFVQQLMLSPERLTGACGRLKCCLAYEHEQYREALEGLPEPGEEVTIDGRTGEIVTYHFFRRTATVAWSDGTRSEVPWDRLKTPLGGHPSHPADPPTGFP